MACNHWAKGDDLPKCCRGCVHLDSESMDEYSPPYFYCNLNRFLPTKKQTCDKAEYYQARNNLGGGDA
jgi:hypothetical protein